MKIAKGGVWTNPQLDKKNPKVRAALARRRAPDRARQRLIQVIKELAKGLK